MDSIDPPPAAVPLTPPTAPGVAEAPKSVWPTVLGIVCIVFGVGGLLMGLWGVVAPFLFSQFAEAMTMDIAPEELEAMRAQMFSGLAISALGLPVAALLLASGIGLVRRRPGAVRLLQWWAGLKIVYTLVAMLAGIWLQQEQIQAQMRAQGPNGPPEAFILAIMIVSLVVGIAWGWALPAFVLAWFARRPIREEVATWRGAPA